MATINISSIALIIILVLTTFMGFYSMVTKYNYRNAIEQRMLGDSEVRTLLNYICSDEMRGRAVGSPQIDTVADYIARFFKSHLLNCYGASNGYNQDFILAKDEISELKINNTSIPNYYFICPDGDSTSVKDKFLIIDERGLDKMKVGFNSRILVFVHERTADIAQIERTSQQLNEFAKAFNVKGLLQVITRKTAWNELLKRSVKSGKIRLQTNKNHTFVNIFLRDSPVIEALFSDTTKQIAIESRPLFKSTIACRNVVALLKGTDPDLNNRYLVITAHYDHLGTGPPVMGDSIYNGARDNGIGVVALLNAIQYFVKSPPRRSIIFVATSAEECGLLGSEFFVKNLFIPADSIILNFNFDGVGYNDTSIVTVIGLGRFKKRQEISIGCELFGLRSFESKEFASLYASSDNYNFARIGIPSITFSPGFTKENNEIHKYYHQPQDQVETLDFEYIRKYYGSSIYALRQLANE